MGTEITARYHRQVVWIRVMVEVTEIAEDCTLLGEALQKTVLDGGLIALIFQYDEEHVVEMLWPERGSRSGGGALRKAETRSSANEECYMYESAAVTIPL